MPSVSTDGSGEPSACAGAGRSSGRALSVLAVRGGFFVVTRGFVVRGKDKQIRAFQAMK